MLTTFQKIKETILITILNVLLPSVDIFTDLGSVIKLYIGTKIHPDCDKRSELEPYTSEEDGLIAAIEKCAANSSADRITYISQPDWATALLMPFLINYIITWIVWWSVDKRKAVSWIAPLLSVYPQVKREFNIAYMLGNHFDIPDLCSQGVVPHLDKPSKRFETQASLAEGRLRRGDLL